MKEAGKTQTDQGQEGLVEVEEIDKISLAAGEQRVVSLILFSSRWFHFQVCPRGQNDCALRLCVIVIFAILTPLTRGANNRMEWTRVGSSTFTYISKIGV